MHIPLSILRQPEVNGQILLIYHKGSIVKRNYYNFTNAEYPDQRIPVGYWNDLQNQRNFFENMMQTLQLTHDELWNLKCISIINTNPA